MQFYPSPQEEASHNFSLSYQQNVAFNMILEWYKRSQDKTFVLAGYAGTGKSTIARYIIEHLNVANTYTLAYTGKAAHVLRQKGNTGSDTIHSKLYKCVEDKETGDLKFELDYETPLRFSPLVVIDEYSMINTELLNDLLRMAKKVLFLGDPFQLPPVVGKNNLEPDYVLTEVHRQALESPVLRAATLVRQGDDVPFGVMEGKEGTFSHFKKENWGHGYFQPEYSQIICGYNATRRAINDAFLREGEYNKKNIYKVICLHNNKDFGVYNGMIGEAKFLDDGKMKLIADGKEKKLRFDKETFNTGKKPRYAQKEINYFDFAWAITCHKSQGSEFPKILVHNEAFGTKEEKQRWLYTAITRASNDCTIIT